MRIASSSNPQIKYVAALQKKAGFRYQEGCFVAEGARLVSEAPRDELRAVYVSDGFLSQNGDGSLPDIGYTEVSDAAFKAMSDTKTPQGVLAVVRMRHYDIEQMIRDAGALLFITENLQDPGNLGTIMRAGEGAGVTGMIMSADTVDVYNPKTVRSTMGSIYRMPFAISEDIRAAAQLCRKNGIRLYAAHLFGDTDYDRADYRKPAAIIIGNEANGLTDGTAACADSLIRIPMKGKVESLNAAAAAAVIAYEASRQRRN